MSEKSNRKKRKEAWVKKDGKEMHVEGASTRGSWLQEALRKERGFKVPEPWEGSEVAKSVLAWSHLMGHVLHSASVSSLTLGIMSFVSSPKIIGTLSRSRISPAHTYFYT